MSEVKRYNSYAEGLNVHFEADSEGGWVTSDDYDAAQSELDALREEIKGIKEGMAYRGSLFGRLQTERDALREELARKDVVIEDMVESNCDMGQFLAAAEQRNSELERELSIYRGSPAGFAFVGMRKDGDLSIQVFSTDRLAQACMQHWKGKGYVCAVLPVTLPGNDAALQPTESGAGE